MSATLQTTTVTRPSPVRNCYGAIDLSTIAKTTAAAVRNLVRRISKAGADEHGSWKFGIDSTKNRKWWESLNWDCYGISRDAHSRKLLAVIQVRQAWKKSSWQWTRVRKSYFLCGTNEDGTTFAHPVPAGVIHAAIRSSDDPCRACQNWMFAGADYRKVRRHGDLACVPVKRLPKDVIQLAATSVVIVDSHQLTANQIYQRGNTYYAESAVLVHLPGTHPDVRMRGLAKIVVAIRARWWQFAAPTAD